MRRVVALSLACSACGDLPELEPLAFVTEALPEARALEGYRRRIEVRGGVPPYRFSLESGDLPAGLSLNRTVGQIGGVPERGGSSSFAIRVTDADEREASRTFQISVIVDPLIITTEGELPPAELNRPYAVQFLALGGIPPYRWTLSAGALPTGVTLSPSGELTGNPTLEERQTFTVQVRDEEGTFRQSELTLSVFSPVRLVTRSIPFFSLGQAVDFRFQAEGGALPYRWSLGPNDRLPDGLALSADGRLTGRPVETGEATVAIQVRDSGLDVATSGVFFIRVLDLQIYDFAPALDFPTVCTATTVSYVNAELTVPDSFAIDPGAMQVTVDVDFTDTDARSNQRLKLVLWAPDGRRTVLCGNGAGLPFSVGCLRSGGIREIFGPGATEPDVPLRVFDGMNPQGNWRFSAIVVEPTSQKGICQQAGTIRLIRMVMAPDARTDPYIVVSGFTRNNLLIDPWVRVAGAGVDESQINLQAVLWTAGANGRREGGLGDDEAEASTFTWTGDNLPPGTQVAADGRVTSGILTSGEDSTVRANDSTGQWSVTLPLFVVPPDWVPAARAF